LEFRILGPLEVFSDGTSFDLGGSKQRALLAVLLLHPNEVVSQDRLVDALWEDDPPESAQKALHVYLSGLRKLVGKDRLETRAPGYLLRVSEGELDLDRFMRLREEGRLQEALALWRGPPLADFAHRRFAQAEIAHLEEVRLTCVEERIERDLEAGRHADLVGELEALVRQYPLRERLRGQLMVALYRSGRQAEALDAYRDARRALVEELGIEPGRELRELQQSILNQDQMLDSEAHAPGDEVGEPRPAFVGREAELVALTAGLDEAFSGQGQLFLLQGEPGIGKSRLAEELAAEARARRAWVFVGRCWEAGGAPAYWPWTQSLRAYVRAAEPSAVRRQLGSSAAEVAQIVPQLRELFSGLPEPERAESEAARFRLFDATAAFLRNAALERPLVLVLDDLHAADEPSLLLLRYVASVLDDCRVLIVGTFRDLDPTMQDPLESTVAELGRAPATRRIRLSGLSRAEVGRLAELTADTVPAPRLIAELHADTAGNPLFVSEIVRLLAAEGLLGVEGLERVPIPETVREAIGRRLRTLSDECRRVLSLGAVFGREFGVVALEQVAEFGGIEKLLSVLDEAIAVRVVEEFSGDVGRLRFGHTLTRDTLYDEIPATHRARLHRRVADVLETLYAGDLDPHLAELAHHFSMAVPAAAPEKAIEYAKRAADRALASLAYEEAARLYELALNVLGQAVPGNPEERCSLLLALGEAQIRAGNAPIAKETFFEAAGLARSLGRSHDLARAAAGYGGRLVWGRAGGDDRLVPLLEEGLAALGPNDVELRVRLLARLAGALRDEHSRGRREAMSREAVEVARRSGNRAALAYALEGRAMAISAPDTFADFLVAGDELLEVAEAIGDQERLMQGHIYRFMAHVAVGDLTGAEVDLERADSIAGELRQPAQLWLVLGARTLVAVATGRFAEAEVLIPQALAFGERAQPDAAIAHNVMQRYLLRDFRGSLEEIEPAVRDLTVAYPARPVFRCVLVHLLMRLGQTEEARHDLDELAVGAFAALPFDQEWLFALSFLAETSATLADVESAPVLYDLLAPWAGLNAVDVAEGFRGSVSRYLGLLAATMDRWNEAASHFEDGMAMNARMGARPWLAHTQCDYAQLLLTRDVAGDAEQARELIEQALVTYRELGMDLQAARASALAGE
jgi:DNA-binding SARP family transcriptional activator